MKNYLAVLAAFWTIYAPVALAGTEQSKPGDTGFMIALGVSFAALAYAANKWRAWWLGFQIGDATASEFLSAMKWSVIGAVVVAASFGIAMQFK